MGQGPDAKPHKQEQEEDAARRRQHPSGEERPVRGCQDKGHGGRSGGSDNGRVPPGQAGGRLEMGPPDGGGRGSPSASQGRPGEDEGDQQSLGSGEDQGPGMEDQVWFHGQAVAEQGQEGGCQGRTCCEAGGDRASRDHGDLQEIEDRDVAVGGPKDLEGSDGPSPRREIARNAIAHAYAGDHQGGQTDQAQELPHSLEEAAGARRGATVVANLPASLSVGALERFRQLVRPAEVVLRQPDPVLGLEETARLDQAR